jgi:AAA family ATP:ADP antiporter
MIQNPIASLRALDAAARLKVALLSSWFFLAIMTLWLLKPVRTASLLVHLGADELPYLRFGSVAVVGLVVLGYSRIVNRFSRLQVVGGASAAFVLLLIAFWSGLQLGGEALGAQRWFVWAVFIMVEIYSTVMVAIFWTYTNDVVSRVEADKLYGPIGVGGILGGVAGGVTVDALVHSIGPVHLLLVCVACISLGAVLAWMTERVLKPAPRVVAPARNAGMSDALEGASQVLRDSYLRKIVGIVVAYEFASALTDFVINIVFERAFTSQVEIAQMYGRLGWIVSGTALLCQAVIVPVLLPFKRVALIVPPIAMAAATLLLALMPIVSVAIVLAASDRGLNYSLQQVTKETLYVPLGDLARYKAKAFIDMFVDRAAKALSSVALLFVMLFTGASVMAALALAFASLMYWVRCASSLGRSYSRRIAAEELAVPAPRGGGAALEEPSLQASPARANSR